MMHVLIYGSKGWIGGQFVSILNKLKVEYVHGKSRIDNLDELTKEIDDVKPTHVVTFAGRTHGVIDNKVYPTIDYLEQPGKIVENIRDNLLAPLQLAILCESKKIHLTYLGTGCIFQFDDKHPFGKEINGFTEESLPNFFGSSYSVVKGFTDRLLHQFNSSVLNLRIRMPIDAERNPRNFITKITTYKKICSIPNSMTVLPELLPYVIDMMKKKITGTINLTNPGLISHNEILEMYKEYVDPDFVWENFSVEEQSKILAAARSNNYLDTTKLTTMYPEIKNIKESVKQCLQKYQKPSIWNANMILLVTGGCGFIGSNFINYIGKNHPNIKIVNIDALYYCADKNNVNKEIQKSKNYKLICGNICSKDLVNHALREHQCTHVVHFAAQSHVQTSFDDSLQYTNDNVLGTHILLESCREYGKIQKFIHVSTDEVYGESMLDEAHKTEHAILCPTNPYAATKAAAEMIVQSYYHSYKMPIIITRGNNVYGPNQYPEKLIPRFIKLLNEDKKVTIQGDGSHLRSFLYVDDVASAFEIIMDKGIIGEIYNIGSDQNTEYSVSDIANLLIKKIKNIEDPNKINDWIEYIEDRPFNDKRYFISNQKLKNLGWTIKKSFSDGISELIKRDQTKSKNINT
jgi:dTDP-glucose 4,6-dehydratase